MMRKISNKINLLLVVFVFFVLSPPVLFGGDINDQNQLMENHRRIWQTSSKERKKETGKTYVEQIITIADEYSTRGDILKAIQLYTKASYMIPNYAIHRKYEVIQKLKNAKIRQKLQNQIGQCSRSLKSDPDNIIIRRKLIFLYIIESDCPIDAKKILTFEMSDRLRTYVPLAAMDKNKIAKEVCLELGDWYMSLASKATLRGKGNVLSRAKIYYKRFVTLEKYAVKRTGIEVKLNQIDKELQKLGIPWANNITLALDNGVTMKLALIPAGEFTMGSPKDEQGRRDDEGPQHEVTISKAFYMGAYEVTQEQYTAVMGKNPSRFKGRRNPVDQVRWIDAVEFCKKISEKLGNAVRLPTEAEWEHACRAGTTNAYSFGDESDKLKDYAWFGANSDKTTHPVGQKKPNLWGLYDMHGNTWEWCVDWYNANYYATNKNPVDPTGPTSGSSRVLRSGAFDCTGVNWYCRSSLRHNCVSNRRLHSVGFRVVVSIH